MLNSRLRPIAPCLTTSKRSLIGGVSRLKQEISASLFRGQPAARTCCRRDHPGKTGRTGRSESPNNSKDRSRAIGRSAFHDLPTEKRLGVWLGTNHASRQEVKIRGEQAGRRLGEERTERAGPLVGRSGENLPHPLGRFSLSNPRNEGRKSETGRLREVVGIENPAGSRNDPFKTSSLSSAFRRLSARSLPPLPPSQPSPLRQSHSRCKWVRMSARQRHGCSCRRRRKSQRIGKSWYHARKWLPEFPRGEGFYPNAALPQGRLFSASIAFPRGTRHQIVVGSRRGSALPGW